ncbi:N-acyl homoserine lactonase family protein [Steroidobacter agaridevorans]|uniref:N-acyl homoserine lactonase family protein n=1 Tax=Steroidobacter agaridevorans TaxID=2695856 RepID=UPI00137B14DD|nr:N-acyl homoserine lactonase family protein [Steroidobacter agaridevorans]
MNPRSLTFLAVTLFLVAAVTPAASPSPVKLWRLDCGVIQEDDLNLFSDTYAYVGKSKQLSAACYLIKHGETYMLWDTGVSTEALGKPLRGPGATGESLTRSLPDQLERLGVDPKQIEIIGISHYHYDHTGQAALFPQARLLMGKDDITAVRAPGSTRAKPLTHWLNGAGKLEEITGDKDVFGDGSVVMLDLPGHTPGHHGLLVKLAKQGYVLLSGDVAHFEENYATNGVPIFNTDRAQSLASLDRFKGLAKNLRATVVIQHEQADIAKLPAFPAYAE